MELDVMRKSGNVELRQFEVAWRERKDLVLLHLILVNLVCWRRVVRVWIRKWLVWRVTKRGRLNVCGYFRDRWSFHWWSTDLRGVIDHLLLVFYTYFTCLSLLIVMICLMFKLRFDLNRSDFVSFFDLLTFVVWCFADYRHSNTSNLIFWQRSHTRFAFSKLL